MKQSLRFIIPLFLSFVALVNTAKAQDSTDEAPIKINTYLVNIPVIASDRGGRYISGLTKDNFTISQDGEKQPIEFFADDKAPMNVAILIDASGSTISLIGNIQRAARDFVKVFRPEDRGLIACFATETYVVSELTSDQKKLRKGIDRAGECPHGGSFMQDAIYRLVTQDFASVKGRKAIIVLTDGMVGGRISNQRLLSILAESDVLVYPILFQRDSRYDPGKFFPKKLKLPSGETITKEEAIRRVTDAENRQTQFMNSLGTVSGGRLFNSNDFKKSFQSIADELKNQYLIGFYPQNVDDGKTHQIAVEVSPKEIVIRTKRRIQLKVSK